jgi:hypothetical protein
MTVLQANAMKTLTKMKTPFIEARMQHHIHAFLANLLPHTLPNEPRHNMRYPYPFLFGLVPVGKDGVTPLPESITVVGKNVSNHGIGFYHREPIPHRRVIIALGNAPDNRLTVLTELLWCRFTRQGWYDSGGRFLEIVTQTPQPITPARESA